MSNRKGSRVQLLLAAAFLLALSWSCNQDTPTETYFNLGRLADSLSRYDSVRIVLMDRQGNIVDTAFHGRVGGRADLEELPAPHYHGEDLVISIFGYSGGELVYHTDRFYDATARKTDSVKAVILPGTAVRLAYGDTQIYVGDTLPLPPPQVTPEALSDKSCAWISSDSGTVGLAAGAYYGAGPGQATLSARLRSDTGKSAGIQVRVAAKPALPPRLIDSVSIGQDTLRLYTGGMPSLLRARVFPEGIVQEVIWRSGSPAVFRVDDSGMVFPVDTGKAPVFAISKADSAGRDSAWILVKTDIPRLVAGADTVIPIGTSLAFAPSVEQEYGGIAKFEWDLDGDGKWDGSADSLRSVVYAFEEAKSYAVRFRVVDGEGNAADAIRNVKAVKGPVALILSPKDSAYARDREIAVSWSINGRIQDSLTLETLGVQGANRIVRSARDSAGILNTASITVFWDTVPPAPPVMASFHIVNTRTPTWAWKSGGGGNGQFRLNVDSPIPENAAIQIDTFFTALSELGAGLHTLLVQERDAAGNWSLPAKLALRIDLEAPPAPVVSTLQPALSNEPKPTWTWKPGGSGGMRAFRYRLDSADPGKGSTEVTDTAFTPGSALEDGEHVLYVQERDSAGNWSPSGSARIRLDLIAPSAPRLEVSPASPTNNAKPAWSWTGGGGGIGVFRYRLDTGDSGPGESPATRFVPDRDLAEGTHVFYVQERDSAGNWSEAASVPVRVDLTPPLAPKMSPFAGLHVSTSRPVWTWTSGGNEGSGVYRCKLNDSAMETGATQSLDGGYAPGSDLSGFQTLYVQEKDSAGNWSAISSQSIRVHGRIGYLFGGPTHKTGDGGATWSPQADGNLASMHFTDARTGYALGGSASPVGSIFKTVNGGEANWFTQSSGTVSDLNATHFVSPSIGYAAGAFGTIVKTSDGGASWGVLASGTTETLTSIRFVSPDTGFAAGHNGRILKTVDGGAAWTALTSGTAQHLFSIFFSGSSVGYAAGNNGTILKTADGGTSWSIQTSGTIQTLYSIKFKGTDTGYAVGYGGTILKTVNAGMNWTPQSLSWGQSGSPTLAISPVSANIAVIAFSGGSPYMARTENGGAAWTQVSVPVGYVSSAQFADASVGYAVGSSGTILKTADAGATWTRQNAAASAEFSGVSFVDANTGWIVGRSGIVYKTTSGGGSAWTQLASGTRQTLSALTFTDANTGYAVGGSGTILKTANAGAGWTPQTSGTTSGLKAVFFANGNTGYAVGDNGAIVKTSNGGALWKTQSSLVGQNLSTVYFVDAANGYAAGSGAFIRTTNGGETWEPVSGMAGHSISSLYFTSGKVGFAVGSERLIYKTTDAGATWTSQASNNGGYPLLSVYFTDSNNGYVTGATNSVSKTSDGGATWTEQSLPSGNGGYIGGTFFP